MENLHERRVNVRCLAWRTSHRSHFEIMASMIKIVKGGASRYSVMKHMGTSSSAIKKYLESATEMGLIETGIEEGRVFYKPTEKGLDFLRQYYVLIGIMLNTRERRSIILPKLVEVGET